MTAMAKETGLSVPAISKAARRGEQHAQKEKYILGKTVNV
jgi:hypothetical protein